MVMSDAELYSREERGGGRAALPLKWGQSEKASLTRHLWAEPEKSWASALLVSGGRALRPGHPGMPPKVPLCSVDQGPQGARMAGLWLRSNQRALHIIWPDLDFIKRDYAKKKKETRKKHACGEHVYEDNNVERTYQMVPAVNSEECKGGDEEQEGLSNVSVQVLL